MTEKLQHKNVVHIWSDGACAGNPGPGGYAAVIYLPTGPICVCGSSEDTTNNIMELTGFVNGLGTAILNSPVKTKIIIHTDSKYIENSINCGWLYKWVKKDFEKIKNVELWKMVHSILVSKNTNVEVVWCKGHSGIADNELADRLASAAMNTMAKEGTIIEL